MEVTVGVGALKYVEVTNLQGTKLENGQVEKHCPLKEVADDLVNFRMFRSLNKCG